MKRGIVGTDASAPRAVVAARARALTGYARTIGAVRSELDALPGVIHAPRTDAIYNCHAYLTKVPIGAITPFVEALSRRGEVVADMFAGSGMTGIAAVMAGRRARLSDISVLGQHIARGYLGAVGSEELRRAGETVLARARAALGDLYRTVREADGTVVEQVRTVWSFVYACPGCDRALVWLALLDADGHAPARSPCCGVALARRELVRTGEVPVRVVVVGADDRQREQAVDAGDLARIACAERDLRLSRIPTRAIGREREMFARCGLARAGIHETRQFFTARNAIALLELWDAIAEVASPAVAAKLRFAFTACLARASRRYQWGPKRPLNAQNQTYYIAPVHYEWNVFDLFARKLDAVARADRLLHRDRGPLDAEYHIASADRLSHLADGSIDYVFCDPPFGSNIFYSDMNLFHEAWLGETTDDASEAVVHTSGGRRHGADARYHALLHGAFAEAFRVLVPGRYLSVVFGNSNGAMWLLLQQALRSAGFGAPVHVAILDKGQRSVKGMASGSEGVVTVDLVITLRKPTTARTSESAQPASPVAHEQLVAAAAAGLADAQARDPSYLYAAVLREAIRSGGALDGLHYAGLLARLRERGFSIDRKTGRLDRPVNAQSWR